MSLQHRAGGRHVIPDTELDARYPWLPELRIGVREATEAIMRGETPVEPLPRLPVPPERSYGCLQCGSRFSTPLNLVRHLNAMQQFKDVRHR